MDGLSGKGNDWDGTGDTCATGGGSILNPIHPHWSGDVFDLLLAHVLKRIRELVSDLVPDDAADANAAGLGKGFQAGRDVDPISEDVVLFDDHIPEVDPNPELDPLLQRGGDIALAIRCCTSTAHLTASITLWNSAKKPSPVFFTIRPRCSSIFGLTSSPTCALSRSCVPSSSAPIRREYPATSTARIAARRRTGGICHAAVDLT
jgi:hypothetical protein